MTQYHNDRAGAVCSLEAGEASARRERWLGLADRSLLDRAATDAGVRLAYRVDPGVEDELRALVAAERECCGFAAWELREPRGGAVVLEVSAEREAVAAVHAMFGLNGAGTYNR